MWLYNYLMLESTRQCGKEVYILQNTRLEHVRKQVGKVSHMPHKVVFS